MDCDRLPREVHGKEGVELNSLSPAARWGRLPLARESHRPRGKLGRVDRTHPGDAGRAEPASLNLAAAGVAPLAGIAALAAVDALALSEGETILIVGATGGVGNFAVQLAARAGATIIAPALAEDADCLRELGVTEQLDRDGDVVAAVRDRHPDGVDALLDLVSYAPGAFDGALRDGARVASSNGAAGEAPGRTNLMAVPSEDNLRRLAALLDDGTLQVHIHDTFEFDRATDALQALATDRVRGKLAISVR